ncbi:hypothetical protein [Pedobacter sp. MW01-1-1]|uniref:hypothetical protein n=1 Tax=Pedobacter sp. MW01-1-1 TaxID=3383027 RepID=UPI003FEF1C52
MNPALQNDPEYRAQMEAMHARNDMVQIQEERNKKEEAIADQLVVIQGAKIKMGAHLGELKVLNDVPTTQGKLTATVVEKQIANFTFYDGFQLLSINVDWQNQGNYKLQDNEVLIKKSTLQVTGKMPGNNPPESGAIEFMDSGQINIPEEIDTTGAPVPPTLPLDFDLELEHVKEDFVPFGIPNYEGAAENDKIRFKLRVAGEGINSWHLKIKQGDNLIYELFSRSIEFEEITINAKANPNGSNLPVSPIENTVQEKRFWPAGTYLIGWDGFDKNGIYDSARMKSKEGFTVNIMGQGNFLKKEYTLKKSIKFSHKEVDWVDVRIDKNRKRIDTTLRVNLTDGGAEGLECITRDIDADPKFRVPVTEYPCDKISKEALEYYGMPPIKMRARSYEELENLALQGINYFWSRNSKNIGNGVNIGSEIYEVYVDAKANKNGLAAPKIVYQTNCEEGRSRNFEASRILFFYEGYLYRSDWIDYSKTHERYKNKGWKYKTANIEDYKMVSAHEIGHEILLAYGGHIYSKAHKGTTTGINMLTQDVDDDAPTIYNDGKEIDLMKYYQNYYDIPRTIISEFDLLKVIWLTKLK